MIMGLCLEKLEKQLDEALRCETTETMLEFLNKQRAKITLSVNTDIMPQFSYDKEADVMYISFGEPKECKSIDIDNVVHRYTLENKLNGITIINYSKRVV